MAVSVNMPSQNQVNPLDRIGSIFDIYRGIQSIGKNNLEKEMLQAQKDAVARRMDANSQESAQARPGYQDLGFKVSPTDSAASLEARYGSLSDLNQKRFGEQEHRKTELAKLGATKSEAKRDFDLLPPEKQEQIKDLAKSSANKTSIKNEIDSALEILKSPQISEDQKIVAGDNLLKLLNSTAGQDAVGAEEAKRLSSFLAFKKFNFTQPGSMFGRDLPEFVDQVALTSSRLGQSIAKNAANIDSLYGKGQKVAGPIQLPEFQGKTKFSLVPPTMANEQKITPQDQEAIKWAKANPKDPRSAAILKANGL